jgi:hypothetical protein
MISETAKSKLRRLMEARTERDEAKHTLEVAEAEFREIEAEVYDEMEESGTAGTIKVDLGEPWGTVAFRTRETIYSRIIDEQAALDYFESRAMLDDVSAPKFTKKRLNEIVRDCREQGLELPPGLDYLPNRGVTITRQKG